MKWKWEVICALDGGIYKRRISVPATCANVDAVFECALPYLLKFFCGLFYNTVFITECINIYQRVIGEW